eukprot:TRINITY_DN15745_c0_g6_i1.p1 TRINITY_DN15745_c0_g6~~TRINITY_DN15745_c0_g6_i1.p1  ORF type:complete len:112 (-),score=11.62 TRINITY_DN15745_c0_g6_i1:205-540(-)
MPVLVKAILCGRREIEEACNQMMDKEPSLMPVIASDLAICQVTDNWRKGEIIKLASSVSRIFYVDRFSDVVIFALFGSDTAREILADLVREMQNGSRKREQFSKLALELLQ